MLTAISGNGTGGKVASVWGWSKIANQLVQSLNTTKLSAEKRAEYRDRYLNARYHVSLCRREYGLSQPDNSKKQQNLEAAKRELESFALLTDDIDPAWKDRFNLEDTLFAGAVLTNIKEHFTVHCDASLMAESMYQLHQHDLFKFIKLTTHYHRLSAYGLESDLEYCVAAVKHFFLLASPLASKPPIA